MRPSPDQAFRQVQLREAEVTRAGRELASAPGCSVEARAAAERVCRASQQLCQLSPTLHDRDATRRCLHAGDACSAAREHASTNCATSPR